MNSNMEHHKRLEYCATRLQYRSSKKLTAVKVYTVAHESKHLLVFGIPKINLIKEIKNKLQQFGVVTRIAFITDEVINESQLQVEQFTDCCHVVFDKLEDARKAKRFLDAKNFYGGILHISYAPERESIDELRAKLYQRVHEVKFRNKVNHSKRHISSGDETISSKILRK